LPSFFNEYSPCSFIPLPLYGSVFLYDFIFAATDPTDCLSEPVILMIDCFSTDILIPSGIV